MLQRTYDTGERAAKSSTSTKKEFLLPVSHLFLLHDQRCLLSQLTLQDAIEILSQGGPIITLLWVPMIHRLAPGHTGIQISQIAHWLAVFTHWLLPLPDRSKNRYAKHAHYPDEKSEVQTLEILLWQVKSPADPKMNLIMFFPETCILFAARIETLPMVATQGGMQKIAAYGIFGSWLHA